MKNYKQTKHTSGTKSHGKPKVFIPGNICTTQSNNSYQTNHYKQTLCQLRCLSLQRKAVKDRHEGSKQLTRSFLVKSLQNLTKSLQQLENLPKNTIKPFKNCMKTTPKKRNINQFFHENRPKKKNINRIYFPFSFLLTQGTVAAPWAAPVAAWAPPAAPPSAAAPPVTAEVILRSGCRNPVAFVCVVCFCWVWNEVVIRIENSKIINILMSSLGYRSI